MQVNCIHPSLVETERQWRRIRAEVERSGETEAKVRERVLPRDRHHAASARSRTSPTRDLHGVGARHLAARRDHRPRRRRNSGAVRPGPCDEHPAHARAHRAGRDPEPHRHAADDDAHGRRRGLRHRRHHRLLPGAGARRRRPDHGRDGLARERPAATAATRSASTTTASCRGSPAWSRRSTAPARRHRSSSATAAATPASTSAARRRSRRRRSRIRCTRSRSRPSCRRR